MTEYNGRLSPLTDWNNLASGGLTNKGCCDIIISLDFEFKKDKTASLKEATKRRFEMLVHQRVHQPE